MKFVKKYLVGELLALLLMIFGFWSTLTETLHLWAPDPDVAANVLFIRSLWSEGWGFLRDFHFPLDNWLFSISLTDALWFRLFGDTPQVMMLTGVVVFWLTAILTAAIVASVSGWRRGLWAGVAILFAPQAALHYGGYLTYPVAHTASVLWGWAALCCALLWLGKRSVLALLGMLFLLSLATFSDPWMLPTIDLPLLCASGAVFSLRRHHRKSIPPTKGGEAYLIGVVIVALILCKTNFLGSLDIGSDNTGSFTKIRFPLLSFPSMAGALSYYFNMIPGMTAEKLGWYISQHNVMMTVGLFLGMAFNATCVFLVVYYSIRASCRMISRMDTSKIFLVSFIVFSILGILSSAFMLGTMKHISSSRYLVNIYYCVVMLYFVCPVEEAFPWMRKYGLFLGSLWFFSSICSNIGGWTFSEPELQRTDMGIVSILKAEHIDVAFGSYWGTQAHTLTWLSNDAVQVRPVMYDPDYHGFLPDIWTSPSWYRVPKHGKWALIITSTTQNDMCVPFPSCEEAAAAQFGPPVAVKQAERATFMIYDSEKAQLPASPNINTWKAPLPLPDEDSFTGWKSYYPNGRMNRDDLVTLSGWGGVNHGKVASTGRQAQIGIPVPPRKRRVLRLRFLLASSTPYSQDLDVRYKGNIVAKWRLGGTETAQNLTLPLEIDQQVVRCELFILKPIKGKHGVPLGVTLSEVQVVDE